MLDRRRMYGAAAFDPLEERVFLAVAVAALGREVGRATEVDVEPFLRALPAVDRRRLGRLLRVRVADGIRAGSR